MRHKKATRPSAIHRINILKPFAPPNPTLLRIQSQTATPSMLQLPLPCLSAQSDQMVSSSPSSATEYVCNSARRDRERQLPAAPPFHLMPSPSADARPLPDTGIAREQVAK